jgi:predicted nucleic acid-binding protein
MPAGAAAVGAGRKVLARLDLIRVNNRVLDLAAELEPENVRSLDAIHLATADQLGDDLDVIVTYDDRMAEAAKQSGQTVVAPY